jgi:hypothetical protein
MVLGLWLRVVLAGPVAERPAAEPPAQAATESPAKPPAPRSLRPRLSRHPVAPSAALVEQRERARQLQLRSLGDGGYAYTGTPGEGFSATIRPDGTVRFVIGSRFQVKLDGVCLVAICLQTRAGKRERAKRTASKVLWTAASWALTLAAPESAAPDGRVYGQPAAGPIHGSELEGPLALTPVAVQGRYGFLPAPIAAMTGFMERTFELRIEMAVAATNKHLETQLRELPQTLADIWKSERPAAQRRAEILALWSSLDAPLPGHPDHILLEHLGSEVDLRRRQAADQARGKVLAFVQQQVPSDSPQAFTTEELETFNARPDVAVPFRPYPHP